MKRHPHFNQSLNAKGFALVEALVSLVVVSFGLLALAGLQANLERNGEFSRQRSEAVRLAEQKIEDLRSQVWANIPVATSPAPSDTFSTGYNTTFTRTWTVSGSSSDHYRTVMVTLSWLDRTNTTQTLVVNSVLTENNLTFSGSVGFPLPQNQNLKQPKNRNLNIPIQATDLGTGESSLKIPASTPYSIVFDNTTGLIKKVCNTSTQIDSTNVNSLCTTGFGYILTGYISLDPNSDKKNPATFPTAINILNLTGASTYQSTLGNAIDITTGSTISGYQYYLCVLTIPTATTSWSGTVKLAGYTTSSNAWICRFQYPQRSTAPFLTNAERNMQSYANVTQSLDNQNYIITTASSCPTISGLGTTAHQDCNSTSSTNTTCSTSNSSILNPN